MQKTETKLGSIAAFFPAFNDSATIASLVITTHCTLQCFCEDFEIVVVNDGSADHTGELLSHLQSFYPRLRVVDHGVNRGYGAALRTGFASCTKDWIFYTDGDAQYDVRELARLIESWEPGVDIINGYKIARSDPFYRVLIGAIYNQTVKWAFGLKLRDIDCDFRLIRRSVFDRVRLHSSSGVICVEMIRRFQDSGCMFKEVPVHHFFRAFGRSQFFNFRRLWRTFIELTHLWGEFRRGKSPDSAN
jgi:glycosyltransferase involved in cell wall biosynthesis